MSDVNYKKISMDGLWNNNPATVQILGLCPLLAVTGSVVNAMGLGLATLVVLMGSNACVSLIRNYVTDAVRLPAFVMIIAAMVTVIEMLMQAYTFELYEILGIFIPLIVTNCAVLGRADAFASKNAILPSMLFGPMAANWELTVIDNYGGFLLAVLPPGAFLGLGLIIAGKNVIDKHLKEVQKRKASDEPKVSRRVRTTGKVS